jgi:hypothetical protein
MKSIGLITLSLISFQAVANVVPSETIANKMANAYKRQQSTAQVHCEHAGLKYISNEFQLNRSIQTHFKIDDFKFSILIKKDGRKFKANFESQNNELDLNGTVGSKDKSISFKFKNLNSKEQNLVNKYKFRDMRCNVEVYKNTPVALKNKKVHINMHPHTQYDFYGVTTSTAENYLNDSQIQNIVFLDNSDLSRGIKLKNFMVSSGVNYRIKEFSVPTVKIPKDVHVYSASAGHSLFSIATQDLEVTYTGGNLNYCILNNVRRLMDTFLQYSDGGVLDIKFDLEGLVAQKGSWLKNASFSGRKRSGYYVQEEFRKDIGNAKKFHKAFREFFQKDQLSYGRKQKLYSKLEYKYEYLGQTFSKTLVGNGKGSYSININFLNE